LSLVVAGCTKSSQPSGPSHVEGPGGTGGALPSGGSGGSGGAGAAGGSGGQATGGAGGGVPLPAWVLDPGTWEALPGEDIWNEACRLEAARPDRIEMPALLWQSCGAGCERADVVQGLGDSAALPSLRAEVVDGLPRAFLRVAHVAVKVGDHLQIVERVIDLNGGQTLGAVRTRVTPEEARVGCSYFPAPAPGLRREGPTSAGVPAVFGGLDPSSRRWWWSLPWRPQVAQDNHCASVLLDRSRQWFVGCNIPGQLYVTAPESSLLEPLEAPVGKAVTSIASGGDGATWSEVTIASLGSRIRTWVPGIAAPRVLEPNLAGDVCKVAVGGGSVAAWSVVPTGERSCSFFQPNGRFHWYGPDATARHGPTLREPLRPGVLATWGQFVAAEIRRDEGEPFVLDHVLLTRSTDWAARILVPPSGYEVLDITLSDRYLYLVHGPLDASRGSCVDVIRYDLRRFDELGDPFDWAEH
jgi:hypothetical protein